MRGLFTGAGTKLATSVTLVFMVLGLGLLINLYITGQIVQNSQHQWCDTLTLLTEHPVPKPADPRANPSRENTYVFYSQLVRLRQDFGCG